MLIILLQSRLEKTMLETVVFVDCWTVKRGWSWEWRNLKLDDDTVCSANHNNAPGHRLQVQLRWSVFLFSQFFIIILNSSIEHSQGHFVNYSEQGAFVEFLNKLGCQRAKCMKWLSLGANLVFSSQLPTRSRKINELKINIWKRFDAKSAGDSLQLKNANNVNQ